MGLTGVGNLADAVTIFNIFCDMIFSVSVTSTLDLITLVMFVICIGWVIHSLANKEP